MYASRMRGDDAPFRFVSATGTVKQKVAPQREPSTAIPIPEAASPIAASQRSGPVELDGVQGFPLCDQGPISACVVTVDTAIRGKRHVIRPFGAR